MRSRDRTRLPPASTLTRVARRGRSGSLACLLLLLGGACSNDFTPRSVLEDLRVLALQAAPLEVGPGESVTLTPVRLLASAGTITEEHWSFCPFSIGGTTAFACAVPACEFPLYDGPPSGDPAVGVPVTADPGALAQRCLALLAAQGGAPPSVPSQLPAKVSTVFRYTAVAEGGTGKTTREAVQLVPFYLNGVPAQRNLPPIVQEVDIGGQKVESGGAGPALEPGGRLAVRVLLDPASVQAFVDDAGRTVNETLVVSFFTTAGRFDFDRANVDFPADPKSSGVASVLLKNEQVPAGVVEAQLWAVATDLRGGETVEGPFLIPVRH